MRKFLSRFADKVTGVLSGLDRLVFRGHLFPQRHRRVPVEGRLESIEGVSPDHPCKSTMRRKICMVLAAAGEHPQLPERIR